MFIFKTDRAPATTHLTLLHLFPNGDLWRLYFVFWLLSPFAKDRLCTVPKQLDRRLVRVIRGTYETSDLTPSVAKR